MRGHGDAPGVSLEAIAGAAPAPPARSRVAPAWCEGVNNPRLPFDEARPLSAVARTLYDHLCWLGEPAVSSLTNNTMGAAIGRSERTVIQALNELAAADLIVREYRAPDRTNPATASGRVIRLRRAPAA